MGAGIVCGAGYLVDQIRKVAATSLSSASRAEYIFTGNPDANAATLLTELARSVIEQLRPYHRMDVRITHSYLPFGGCIVSAE
jgi:hypothetical protein